MFHQLNLLRLKHFTALLLPVFILAACSQEEEPAPEAAMEPTNTGPIAYVGARLIRGDGSPAIENSIFIVENGAFQLVGSSAAVTIPADTTQVDLSGRTVMPAILDTHTHLSIERDALIEDLSRRVTYGVSAAMSLGRDYGDAPYQIQNEVIPGVARYLTAGLGITAPEPGRTEDPYWVTTAEEARTAVQTEAAKGVDIIKIWVDDRDGQYEKLSPELYGAVIDEAHRNNLRVTAHIFNLSDAKGLLRAGIDAFAHGIRDVPVDEEVIMLFQERPNVVVVPNLPGRGVATDLSWLQGTMPDAELAMLQAQSVANPEDQQAFAIQAANLASLNAAGVTIALGTDGNTPWGPHLEMEDMVISGMTPMQVITASTSNAAAFLGLDEMGSISNGKSADFIVLAANPLDDITNTRTIVDVYLRGEEIERNGM